MNPISLLHLASLLAVSSRVLAVTDLANSSAASEVAATRNQNLSPFNKFFVGRNKASLYTVTKGDSTQISASSSSVSSNLPETNTAAVGSKDNEQKVPDVVVSSSKGEKAPETEATHPVTSSSTALDNVQKAPDAKDTHPATSSSTALDNVQKAPDAKDTHPATSSSTASDNAQKAPHAKATHPATSSSTAIDNVQKAPDAKATHPATSSSTASDNAQKAPDAKATHPATSSSTAIDNVQKAPEAKATHPATSSSTALDNVQKAPHAKATHPATSSSTAIDNVQKAPDAKATHPATSSSTALDNVQKAPDAKATHPATSSSTAIDNVQKSPDAKATHPATSSSTALDNVQKAPDAKATHPATSSSTAIDNVQKSPDAKATHPATSSSTALDNVQKAPDVVVLVSAQNPVPDTKTTGLPQSLQAELPLSSLNSESSSQSPVLATENVQHTLSYLSTFRDMSISKEPSFTFVPNLKLAVVHPSYPNKTSTLTSATTVIHTVYLDDDTSSGKPCTTLYNGGGAMSEPVCEGPCVVTTTTVTLRRSSIDSTATSNVEEKMIAGEKVLRIGEAESNDKPISASTTTEQRILTLLPKSQEVHHTITLYSTVIIETCMSSTTSTVSKDYSKDNQQYASYSISTMRFVVANNESIPQVQPIYEGKASHSVFGMFMALMLLSISMFL